MEYSEKQIKIHSRITETSTKKERLDFYRACILSMYYLRMAATHIISAYIRQGMFPSGESHHLRYLPAEA